MSDPAKAVFLSYASQDAEAARRIAEALRASGVEVWFDAEGGLETGDEWDAKIRRQIKECVLFLPVISANTQAREEGYFRIEWDLAAERARGIASGVAFILPIVIDDTREPDALVPDRFRSVQWTRLPGGEVTPEVKARFLKLWSHRAGMAKQQQQSAAPASVAPPASAKPRGINKVALGLVAVAAVAAIFLLVRPRPTEPSTTSGTPAAAHPATAADYPRDPELRRARALLYSMDAIPEDFVLAEDIVKPLVAQRPNDPEVATVAAEISLEFLVRGFDLTASRRSQIQRQAERAAQLAPDNAYALAALARFLLFIDAQHSRAEDLIRRSIALRPDEARFHRTLYEILSRTKPSAEVDAYGERMAAQFPDDALVAYDIARRFKDANDLAQAEKWFDLCLGHEKPPSFAYIWKAWIEIWVHGNLPAAKQWLDRVPDRQRANSRVASARYLHAMLSGETDHALRALNETADDWLSDFDYTGPKALLVGNLQLQRGHSDVAKVVLESALAAVTAAADKTPTDLRLQRARMWVLISLGRMEEARAIQRVLLQTTRRPYQLTLRSIGWNNQLVSCLLLGMRDDATAQLREACTDPNSRLVIRNLFKLDPRLAPWREDPEITALLAEPAAKKAENGDQRTEVGAAIDQKSVAVLAFANLSDDKANEYFSDGISEELLNVLAKVPGLKVSARTSAFFFKGKEVPIPEIAKQLGVAYVVEGSVRKAGDKVRITAQLIKAADGFHVWSDTFTRDLKDIFAVQDEIARLIAQQLQLKLGEGGARGKVDPALYELLLQARALTLRESNEDWRQAILLYRRALEREPRLALAWAELARTYVQLGRFGGMPIQDAMREARAASQRALELEPDQATGLVALGWVQRTADWDWRAARQSFQRALELAPGNASIMGDLAVFYFNTGRVSEATTLARQAVERDPLNARAQASLGFILNLNGDWEQALPPLRQAVALAPAIEEVRSHQARALMALGQVSEAVAVAEQEPNEAYRLIARAFIPGSAADAALAEFVAKYGEEMPGYVANLHGIRGEIDPAFAWFERALARRDAAVVWVKTNINNRSLRADPRWPVFLRKVGLADDQLK